MEQTARQLLEESVAPTRHAVSVGIAPGRCTLVGEHVDYADGLVTGVAIDATLAVAVRPTSTPFWLFTNGGGVVQRTRLGIRNDWTDRLLAVALALGRCGVEIPPLAVAVSSELPAAAGLSSSAALSCAAAVAMLRVVGAQLTAEQLASVALVAEQEIVGIPCGPLDQCVVVHAPRQGALLLDCREGSFESVPWGIAHHVLLAWQSGEHHDVGGAGYRERRAQADAAQAALGAVSWRDVTMGDLARASLDEVLRRRAQHIVSETVRGGEAAEALRRGDAEALGRLMHASHVSLRDDYQVSTTTLDRMVIAVEAVDGCRGARLVGAGFGGTVIALVAQSAMESCVAAMKEARHGDEVRILRPSPGVALRAPDVIATRVP